MLSETYYFLRSLSMEPLFAYLNPPSIVALRRTCRYWYGLVDAYLRRLPTVNYYECWEDDDFRPPPFHLLMTSDIIIQLRLEGGIQCCEVLSIDDYADEGSVEEILDEAHLLSYQIDPETSRIPEAALAKWDALDNPNMYILVLRLDVYVAKEQALQSVFLMVGNRHSGYYSHRATLLIDEREQYFTYL